MLIEQEKPDLSSKEQFKAYKMKLHQAMVEKQRLPYNIKVERPGALVARHGRKADRRSDEHI